jgi:hypothetical protein
MAKRTFRKDKLEEELQLRVLRGDPTDEACNHT